MLRVGTTELIIILVIVILLFGRNRIGDIAGEIGRGIREFRSGLRDEDEEEDQNQDQDQDEA
jgi:sec-independent protein translocase protein TatA